MTKLYHVIPGLGPATFPVYPPADTVLDILTHAGETTRLKRLLHVGALTYALPGIAHSRWDYVASMLYLAAALHLPTHKLKFKDVTFSSVAAAIQTAALLTNVGHLPGTFAVEKGVCRWLYTQDQENPLGCLPWPEHRIANGSLQSELQRYFSSRDYLGLSRILGIIRLDDIANQRTDGFLSDIIDQFYLPLLLPPLRSPDHDNRWEQIGQYYQAVRRIAYLTLDALFAHVPTRPSISDLVKTRTDSQQQTIQAWMEQVSETLGAFEHSLYEELYHNERCRKVTAITASIVLDGLQKSPAPQNDIARWLTLADMSQIVDEKSISQREPSLQPLIHARFRSHFLPPLGRLADREPKMFGTAPDLAPLFLRYDPWEREHHLEPHELTLSVFSGKPTPNKIGHVIRWVVFNLDTGVHAKSKDTYVRIQKHDLGPAYEGMLSAAVHLALGDGWSLKLQAWPLEQVHKDWDECPLIPVWIGGWDLASADAQEILRKHRRVFVGPSPALVTEYQGLVELGRQLHLNLPDKRLRRVYLIVTASIRVIHGNERIAEFDGGVIQLDSRSGNLTFYLLESKSENASRHALTALKRKIKSLSQSAACPMDGGVELLGKHSAYWTWRL